MLLGFLLLLLVAMIFFIWYHLYLLAIGIIILIYFFLTWNRILYFDFQNVLVVTIWGLKKIPLKKIDRIHYYGSSPSVDSVIHIFINGHKYVFELSSTEKVQQLLVFLSTKIEKKQVDMKSFKSLLEFDEIWEKTNEKNEHSKIKG